jgi:hypothetical protein
VQRQLLTLDNLRKRSKIVMYTYSQSCYTG